GVPTLKAIEFWEGNSQEREDTHTFKSVKVGEEDGGAWYYCDRMQQRFWLCAHLFDYFNQAPEVLMVQVFI
ncbi:MAG: hypothetical protein NZ482_10330, partial [Gloeomargarita sp. SKYG98]|nr:hypothetical protein [Gloeomargarita sp. SKYG98]